MGHLRDSPVPTAPAARLWSRLGTKIPIWDWHSEDKESKEIVRRSACLGVRRIYGSHTHDVIAKAISDFPADFQISYKVNCRITDNGSNFLKAFKMFSM
jgi:hypothetical protein